MSDIDYVTRLRADSDRLAAAAEAGIDRPVAGCPGWDVGDLVHHVGGIYEYWAPRAAARSTEPAKREAQPRPDDDAALLVSFRESAGRLADELAALDPSTPMWTWSARQDAGWVQRRMAHETAVHRWDGESAVGVAGPIEPADFAVDGIDEFLTVFFVPRVEVAAAGERTVHLHATDADGEFFVRPDGERFAVERAHAKGDAAARGPASDLLLLLWGRAGADDGAVEVLGDRAAVDVVTGLGVRGSRN